MANAVGGRKVGEIILAVALGAGVIALLFQEGSGAYLLWGHEKDYAAPAPLWWWTFICTVGAIVLFVAAYLVGGSLKQDHAKFVADREAAKLTPQQRRIIDLQDQGYAWVGNLDLEVELDEGARIESIQATLVAQPAVTHANGFTTRLGALVYPGGERTELEVGVLFGGRAWQLGDAKLLMADTPGTATKLEDALSAAPMRKLALNADYVVCFGLASNEKGDDPNKNEALSDARADNLCRTVRNLDLMHRSDASATAIGLGQAVQKPTDDDEAERQRAAVVVAVTDAFRVMSGMDVAIAAGLMAPGTNLKGYQRTGGAYSIRENVQKGPLVDPNTNRVSRERVSGIIVRPRQKSN